MRREVVAVAVASALPGIRGPLAVGVQRHFDRRKARAEEFCEQVVQDDLDRVAQRLVDDERFGDAFVKAVRGVADTPWEPKRRAMGRVVREAVIDPSAGVLEETDVILDALADLDAQRFAALARLDVATEALGEDMAGVAPDEVEGLTVPIAARLVAAGAATLNAGLDGMFYRSSDLGRRLLALVTTWPC